MIFHEGFYYYCESKDHRRICLRKASTIFAIGQDPGICIWNAPEFGPNCHAVWAPELHRIDGKWFIYYAADNGKNKYHRMWVLESASDDPMGPYQCYGPLETQGWAIDGTILKLESALYMIWSGWPTARNGQQNLYIAPMSDPVTVAAPRVLLTTPREPWERCGMPICEAPQVLQRNGRIFIVYSASGSWTVDYCLGLLAHRGGDLLDPAAWEKQGPVFEKTSDVWGVGHCSFVPSPCGAEDWMLYHSKSSPAPGWHDRDVHAKQFAWRPDGLPDFGRPGPRVTLPAPTMLSEMTVQFPMLPNSIPTTQNFANA